MNDIEKRLAIINGELIQTIKEVKLLECDNCGDISKNVSSCLSFYSDDFDGEKFRFLCISCLKAMSFI